jgi:protein SCO1/2
MSRREARGAARFQRFFTAAGCVCLVAYGSIGVHGQVSGAPAGSYKQVAGLPASAVPAPLGEIGFDQNIGARLPLDAAFSDEQGRTVPLGEHFGKRPVVLVFAYFDCPMLCTQVVNALASALKVISLRPGIDFETVVISFDPRDTPATATARKTALLERYRPPAAGLGWHFLTGDEPSIRRVTRAAGFRYAWDDRTRQFAHPTGVIVVTPDGRLARYLFGIEYGSRDLRLALVEASAGQLGSRVDALLLYCFHYDPATGRYGLVIMRTIRLAGAATVLGLGSLIFLMVRRERLLERGGHVR